MKVHEAMKLCRKYGCNTTLGDLVRIIRGNRIHKCPKCGGSGVLHKT